MQQKIIYILLAGILSLITSVIIAPLVIKTAKNLKVGQNILKYVTQHNDKQGTPTMGGFIFIIPVIMYTLIFAYNQITLVGCVVVLSYMLLGFLDDYIKIHYKQNQGLKAYQKIIGQFGIAIIVTMFCYYNRDITPIINLPFSDNTLNMGGWYIPFTILVFIATTNAVNLTDGLDGLAGSVSSVYFLFFVIILIISMVFNDYYGQAIASEKDFSLAIFSMTFLCSLVGYLCFNTNKASIMMGDTGSMAIGGGVAVVSVFSKNPLLILILGFIFVFTCISIIIQVTYFKCTRKRVFLMSPFHHHLEKLGYSEAKITMWYVAITFLMGLLSLLSL